MRAFFFTILVFYSITPSFCENAQVLRERLNDTVEIISIEVDERYVFCRDRLVICYRKAGAEFYDSGKQGLECNPNRYAIDSEKYPYPENRTNPFCMQCKEATKKCADQCNDCLVYYLTCIKEAPVFGKPYVQDETKFENPEPGFYIPSRPVSAPIP